MSGNASLVIAFDARIGNLESQLRNVERSLKRTDDATKAVQRSFGSLSSAMSGIGRSITAAIGPMVAAFTIGGLTAGITSAIRNINALADAAAQVGLQAPQLQAIQIAFEEAGGSAEQAQTGMGRLATLIGDAARGGKSAQETFVALGVSFRNLDGTARSTQQAFDDLANKIRSAATDQEALSLAAQVFGQRGARSAVAAIREMGGSIDSATDKYRQLGLIIGDETAQKLDNIGTSFANLGRAIISWIADAVAYVEPAITAIIDALTRAVVWIRDNFIGPVVDGIETVVNAVGPMVSAAINGIIGLLTDVANKLKPIFDWTISRLGRVYEFARRVLQAVGLVARSAQEQAEYGVRQAQAALGPAERQLQLAQQRFENASRQPGTRAYDLAERRLNSAREAFNQARGALEAAQGELARAQVPELPDLIPPPGANPPVPGQAGQAPRVEAQRGGGGSAARTAQRDLERQVTEAQRVLQRLFDSTRTPLEQLNIDFGEVTAAIRTMQEQAGRQPGVSFETYARGVEEAVERTARAMQAAGASTEEIQQQIQRSVQQFGESLVQTGSITATELETLMQRAQAATEKVTGPGGFFGALTQSLTSGKGKGQSFEQQIGSGLGGIIQSSVGELTNLFDKVAEGSMKAGEAVKQFALGFIKSVAQMVAQAAALRMIQALIGGIGGGVGGGVKGLMAGGATAAGVTYLVGERGPELWTAPAAGRVIPNHQLGGGGLNLTVNNNAPGVVVREQRISDRDAVMVVEMSRGQIAADYQESMNRGTGAYAEGITGRYNVRRRV